MAFHSMVYLKANRAVTKGEAYETQKKKKQKRSAPSESGLGDSAPSPFCYDSVFLQHTSSCSDVNTGEAQSPSNTDSIIKSLSELLPYLETYTSLEAVRRAHQESSTALEIFGTRLRYEMESYRASLLCHTALSGTLHQLEKGQGKYLPALCLFQSCSQSGLS